MANLKDIKARIESVSETRKITNAMYLISSSKMQKAKKALDLTRPYFDAVKGEIKRIFRTASDVQSIYLYPDEGSKGLNGTFAYLVITADKGLAGSYNHNVLREAMNSISEHKDFKLFVVGEYGRQFFLSHGIPIERSFLYTAQNPTFHRAREISAVLIDLFINRRIDKLFIIYTDYRNGISSNVKTSRLLPFHKTLFSAPTGERRISHEFEFYPSVGHVLESIAPSFVQGFIFSALIDSFCCEQSARMAAMDSANRNADKLLHELRLTYNHLRQSSITQEITEVSAGAKYSRNGRG